MRRLQLCLSGMLFVSSCTLVNSTAEFVDDSGVQLDAGELDAGQLESDAGPDAGPDTGPDAGADGGVDAGAFDAGPCPDGFGDCDANPSNGCETEFGSVDHCRMCGDRCAWTCGAAGCIDPVAVSVGVQHACAALSNGTAACWGDNTYGQLGDGTMTGTNRPVLVAGLGNVVDITAGDRHSCSITSLGDIQCWGSNLAGEIGHGLSTDPVLSPAFVNGISDAESVVLTNNLSCARRSAGNITCWGGTLPGQLGDGTDDTFRNAPGADVLVVTDARDLAVAHEGVCVIRDSGGGVFCWGSVWEELSAPRINSSSPVQLGAFGDSADVGVSLDYGCAVSAGGVVTCQGRNLSGQLGDGSMDDSLSATVDTGITNAVEVTTNERVACARLDTGQVLCWGTAGAVGDGTTFPRLEPTPVLDLTNAVQLSSGPASNATCALLESRDIVCWGPATTGTLGDGTNTPAIAPVTVLAPE